MHALNFIFSEYTTFLDITYAFFKPWILFYFIMCL